jgi:hypothetical protein
MRGVRTILRVVPLALVACSASTERIASSSTSQRIAPLTFESPAPWAEPIADYLAFGATRFPDGFNRAITALHVFDDQLWIGYGDATKNLGTLVPIELRRFATPEQPVWQAAPIAAAGHGVQRTLTDTGEEQIEPFRVCAGVLCQAGVDSNDHDEQWSQARGPERVIEGNVFRLEHGDWRKFRSIPGGEHVHDLATLDGVVYAVGSGAANRAEFEAGQIYRYLWRSTDGGRSFQVAHRAMFPELGKGDTRFRRLLAVGHTLYVFGFVNPFVDGGPPEGRHLRVIGDRIEALAGVLASLTVHRTVELPDATGLVITRATDGRTRSFRAREDGFAELAGWAGCRVIDAVAVEPARQLLVACGDNGASERFSIQTASLDNLDHLRGAAELGAVTPSSIAVWRGALFVGTSTGAIWKARARIAR